MRKEITVLFFALFFLFPLISAVDIELSNNLSLGETSIVKISGNFLDQISLDNVKFYRGHVQTYFDYNVGKIGDNYYVYFQTQNKPANNYSINISGVRYYSGAQIFNEPFSEEFSVNSRTADFNINPGIVVSEGNFSIEVQNIATSSITITLDTEITSGSTSGFFDFIFRNKELTSQESFELSSGEIKNLDIFLEGITESTIRSITLSSSNTEYTIPVYIIILSSEEQTTENQTTQENPTEDETVVNDTTNESDEGSFWDLFKKENKTSENTNTSDSGYNVIIDDEGNEIIVNKKGEVVESNVSLKSCSQLKGDICTVSEETCDGTKVNALNGECCIGTCIQKETNNRGKIIGWAIIGFIVILLIAFKIKLNKTKKKKFKLPGIDKK